LHGGAVRREFNAVNDMYLKYFKIFGIEKYIMRFSTHDPSRLTGDNAKFVNEPELWKKTEDLVRQVLIDSKIPYVEVPNEAAFYGPKIDVQVWSVIGREFTLATNQVDFAVPAQFGPEISRQGQFGEDALVHSSRAAGHARAVHRFSHRALRRQLPALARAGASARADHRRRRTAGGLRQIHRGELRASFVRAEGDFSTNKINGKIQEAEKARVHTMLVIGPRDMQAGAVSVRVHGKGNAGAKPKAEAVAEPGFVAAIRERRA
jgi:threonyl-tRNA synthetase